MTTQLVFVLVGALELVIAGVVGYLVKGQGENRAEVARLQQRVAVIETQQSYTSEVLAELQSDVKQLVGDVAKLIANLEATS